MTSVTITDKSKGIVDECRVPTTTIELSTLEDIKGVIESLFEEHYEEIARNKQIMKLKPNWDVYHKAEDLGTLFTYLAKKEGKCVGYSSNMIGNHLHYADLLYCQNDLLFVSKEHRGGSLGIKLMKATEKHAKLLGCKLMLWHAKQDTTLAQMLPRLKYGVQDIVFSKEL